MPRLCAAHMTFKFMSKERELVIFNIICRLGSLTGWPRASGSYAKALKKHYLSSSAHSADTRD